MTRFVISNFSVSSVSGSRVSQSLGSGLRARGAGLCDVCLGIHADTQPLPPHPSRVSTSTTGPGDTMFIPSRTVTVEQEISSERCSVRHHNGKGAYQVPPTLRVNCARLLPSLSHRVSSPLCALECRPRGGRRWGVLQGATDPVVKVSRL